MSTCKNYHYTSNDKEELSLYIKRQRRAGNRWSINSRSKTLVVPVGTDQEKVKEVLNKFKTAGQYDENDPNSILGDTILYCGEDALLSSKLINVYNKDGTSQSKNYCRTCTKELIINFCLNSNNNQLFNEQFDKPNMDKIYENKNVLPAIELLSEGGDDQIIPLGQMFWAFISDPDVASAARTYITANALQTLRMSPFITFCPQHPSLLFRKPPPYTQVKCLTSGCNYLLCPDCNKWHQYGTCPEKTLVPLGDRVCPYCKSIIEKSEACNHLHCSCGKHFCYYCGAGPWDDSGPCYDHLSKEHRGCFNDPPDYRKYIKKENVSQSELDEFYTKYPQFKDLRI